MMRVLDIFSGLGGFSLGLERTGGFRTVAFCEIEPFCRRILAKHWPKVPCYDDVRQLTAERLAADGISVDVICGGFPCQDVSIAQGAKRRGLDGERSGLWSEYARLIGELQPRYVLVENVIGLRSKGMGRVLGDLAALGYDAEWHCIPAAAVGAPHIRDRVWLVGYPDSHGQPASAFDDEVAGLPSVAPYANGGVLREQPRGSRRKNRPGSPLAEFVGFQGATPDADSPRLQVGEGFACHDGEELASSLRDDWRLTEPAVCRADDGIPHRVDRIRALGNAVVPQVVTLIGNAIIQSEARL